MLPANPAVLAFPRLTCDLLLPGDSRLDVLLCRFHPAAMPFMSEAMPLLSLGTAGAWKAEELRYLQSHFSNLGSALTSAMQFALAEACDCHETGQLNEQPHQQPAGMLDAAGTGILEILISFVQQCAPEAFSKVRDFEDFRDAEQGLASGLKACSMHALN